MRACTPRCSQLAPRSLAIVGGGLAGLSAAHFARQAWPECRIKVYEQSSRLGGWVQSHKHQLQDGSQVILESGPRSIRPHGPNAHHLLNIIHALDLQNDIIAVKSSAVAAKKRFIYSQQGLEEMPSSILSLIAKLKHAHWRTIFSEICSDVQKFRTKARDESANSFLNRRFGPKTAQLASAMMHGIYAADSNDLSIRATFPSLWKAEAEHFNVITGMMSNMFRKKDWGESKTTQSDTALISAFTNTSIYTLKNGLQDITDGLERSLKDSSVSFQMNEPVEAVRTASEQIAIASKAGVEHFDHAIAAVPANILSGMLEHPSIFLKRNPMTTVGVVSIVYNTADLSEAKKPTGFGYLVPRGVDADLQCLGVVFDSDAFPERAPGKTILTVMLGGPYWKAQEPPVDLVERAQIVLEKHINISRTIQPQLADAQLQKNCIPTYEPGHLHRTAHLHRHLLKHYTGKLSVIGAGYGGVSLNDVVQSAHGVVQTLDKTGIATGLEPFEAYVKELA